MNDQSKKAIKQNTAELMRSVVSGPDLATETVRLADTARMNINKSLDALIALNPDAANKVDKARALVEEIVDGIPRN